MSNVMNKLKTVMLLLLTTEVSAVPAHGLTVELHLNKMVLAIGEPLLLSITIGNHGAQGVMVIHHNAPTLYRGLSTVDILFGPDQDQMKRWSDDLRPVGRTEPTVLGPGKSMTVDFVMLFNSREGVYAKKAGTYWIQGRIVAQGIGDILSRPVAIEVREPDPGDRAVWEWLKENQEHYGRLIQIPWAAELPQDFIAECQRLCETSDSIYTEYLALFLSRWYWEGPEKDRAEAAKYARIAQERASSETMKELAAKALSATE